MTKRPTKAAAAKAKKGAAPKAAPAAPPPDTRESLIAAMATLLDDVERALPKYRGPWSYPDGPLANARMAVSNLVRRMHMVLMDEDDAKRAAALATGMDPDAVEEMLSDNEEAPDSVFTTALAAAPGDVSRLTRRCQFIEWVGYVPVLFTWGGFVDRTCTACAIVPELKFISASGFQSLHPQLPPAGNTLRALARSSLQTLVNGPKFNLVDIEPYGRKEAAKLLAENEWMRNIVAAGPTADAISLPRKFLMFEPGLQFV